VIVDTSVWVEFFRGTGSAAHRALEARIQSAARIVVPDVVVAEVLVGTTDEMVAARLERTLAQFEISPTAPVLDALEAAAIHRACRRDGETVRSLIDCQVAAAALRLDLEVLHRDRDFEVMARVVGLRTVSTLDG
jgi:predicted nucleic acid-binding protein